MKITLNLASKPYADQGPALKRLRIGMGVLALVLVLLGLGMLHTHQAALAMAAKEAALDHSIASVQHEEMSYEQQMQQPANAKVLTQAQFLNKLFDEKSFSWTAAMEDLEQVLPPGVQVTAIEPVRAKDGTLTLKLRVSGQRERAVQMVRNMEGSRRFAQPRVSGENAETGAPGQGSFQQVQDTTNKVSFDILAEYNPATLAERKAAIAAMKAKRGGAAVVAPAFTARPAQPTYIAPNPVRPRAGTMPGQMPGRNFGVPPGLNPGLIQGPAMRGPNRNPNMGPNGPQGASQSQDPEMPSGIDPSGLKNHDRNRFPRPGDVQQPSDGGPQ